MRTEGLSSDSVKYALNCAGFSSRSYVVDDGRIVVGIQVPLSLSGGTRISYGASIDLDFLRSNIYRIAWEEDRNGYYRLALIGNNVAVSIGNDITLPEGHDIYSHRHYPLIHQGNDEGRAERIYAACVSGSDFDFCSIIKTFSWMSDKAIAELLRHGPGYKTIHISSREVYEDLFPHLAQAFPWADTLQLPFPLKDVEGWVAHPITEG